MARAAPCPWWSWRRATRACTTVLPGHRHSSARSPGIRTKRSEAHCSPRPHLPPPPGPLGSPGLISQYPDDSPHSRASVGKIWWELQLTGVKSYADGGDFSKDRPVQLVCGIWRKTWAAQSTSYWTHPAIEPLKCTYFKSPSWDGLYVYNTHYILKIVAEKKSGISP